MSDCCGTSNDKSSAAQVVCPGCLNKGHKISQDTLLHHVAYPWRIKDPSEKYWFCPNFDCHVAYYDSEKNQFTKDQLRTKIGIKEADKDTLICYCFGVSQNDALQNPEIKKFVAEQTKLAKCACTTRNPSGKCCLKDFP